MMSKEDILDEIKKNLYSIVLKLLNTKACKDEDFKGQLIIIKSALLCVGDNLLMPFYKCFDKHSKDISNIIETGDFSILDSIVAEEEVSDIKTDKVDTIQFIIDSIKNYSKDPEFKTHSSYFIDKISNLYKCYLQYGLYLYRK
jgi:hypothetical protein